jgi:hypothetical protein
LSNILSRSEGQFKPELQVSRRKGSTCLAERGTIYAVISQLEVRVIENVEGFHPELESESFRDMKVLEKRSIGRPVSWA